MLCERCKRLLDHLSLNAEPQKRWTTSGSPLMSVLCDRCGGVLPTVDPGEAMLSKLTQLSKFGIGADDRPILSGPAGRD